MDSEKEKCSKIQSLLHRTDPGKDGIYIDLGSLDGFQKYVLSDHTWEEDPSYLRSPLLHYDLYGIMMDYYGRRRWYDAYPIPLEWVSRARVIYGTPLKVKIPGLGPQSKYTLSVTYPQLAVPSAPESLEVTLFAGNQLIHNEVQKKTSELPDPVYTYQLPAESYSDGTLSLCWQVHGTLNPFAVSEIWIRKV